MKKKAILAVNGPAGAGKDTIARYLEAQYPGVAHVKFAKKLKEMCHAAYGIDKSWDYYDSFCPNNPGKRLKDLPQPEFFGVLPRKVYIDFSENFIKPLYGKDFWVKRLLTEIDASPLTCFVISDLGFQIEWETMVAARNKYDLSLIRLFRGTCNYANDSREFVDARGPWKYIKLSKEESVQWNKYIIRNCHDLENNWSLNPGAPAEVHERGRAELFKVIDPIAKAFFNHA